MNRIAHSSRSFALLAGLVMLGGVAVAPAMAATITYQFTGTVNNVDPALIPSFRNPATMTGSMIVNTSDTNSNGNNGTYNIQSIQVKIGTFTAILDATGNHRMNIRNGPGGSANGDRIDVLSDVKNSNALSPIDPDKFTIDLRGPNNGTNNVGPNNVFTSDALPNPVPSLSSFTNRNRFQLTFNDPDDSQLRGFLTTLTAVPLPPAVILFGVGLVALIGLGAGGLRNLRLPQAS